MRFLERLFGQRREPPPPAPPPPPAAKLAKMGSGGRPYPALTTLIAAFEQAETPADALVLGDSVMERVARQDEDKRTLGEMIADALAPARTAVISASANNPLVYRELLAVLERMAHGPRTIVLPVNLRAFSPQWHLNPDWQMTQEREILQAYAARALPEIPPIADVFRDDAAHAALSETPVDFALSERGTMGAFRALAHEAPSPERSREIFVFHYTHRLAADHPKLQALADAVRLAARIAPQLVVYVTPLNVEAGARHVGPAFRDIVRANVATVTAALSVPVLDWHDALPESAFFHDDLATEHLNETGRRAVAERIGGLKGTTVKNASGGGAYR